RDRALPAQRHYSLFVENGTTEATLMNRLQKKCFIASAGLHLLLVIILFIGPAFLGSREKPVTLQYIDIIPFKVIEAPFVGGGNHNDKTPKPYQTVQASTLITSTL